MIRLAVVGDICSGKTYIARQFGYPVFNADKEVAKLYKKNRKCFNKLKRILPKYISSFPIKKQEITQAILSNKKNIKKVTKIIHPEIRKILNNFIKRNKKKKMIVLDIPLFIENKINKKSDIIVFIQAEKKEIYKRLKKRSKFNNKLIGEFKKIQLPLEIKRKKSNFIIKNNFKSNTTKNNVKIILKKIFLNA